MAGGSSGEASQYSSAPNPSEPATSHPDLLLEAARTFGISYLYPYQRLVISNVLDNEPEAVTRQIVVLPTGAGKTLCFQLPAQLLPGLTIVVYPLLSLMADQLRRANEAGLKAVVLGGGQSRAERDLIWRSIASGDVRIILTNPETVGRPEVCNRLASSEISHLVVDEAHCVTEWGETFREAYLELGRVIRELTPSTTTAFTATASPPVLKAVRSRLFGTIGAHLIQSVPDRPNIAYSVIGTRAKEYTLRNLLSPDERDGLQTPALVFCRSRRRVEAVAGALADALGWESVGAYHAGMSRDERKEIEEWFFAARKAVLVATCAYGMGVDKSDIRTTIHYDLPGTVEAFLQESGRSGRDGDPAVSVVLFGEADFALAPLVADRDRRRRYAQLLEYCQISSCRRVFLMDLLGSECEACFGCDNCRSAADDPARDSSANSPQASTTEILSSPGTARLINSISDRVRLATTTLLAFLRQNPRLLTADQTARVVRGHPEPSDRWMVRRLPGRLTARSVKSRSPTHRWRSVMPLERWSQGELLQLLEGLTTERIVRRISRGPWRGKLRTCRGAGNGVSARPHGVIARPPVKDLAEAGAGGQG